MVAEPEHLPKEDEEQRRYEIAKKRAQDLQGFLTHFVVYIVVNTMLFLINLFTRGTNGDWWFYWPLLGWGVAVAIHAATFFIPVFSPDWVERRAQETLRREKR